MRNKYDNRKCVVTYKTVDDKVKKEKVRLIWDTLDFDKETLLQKYKRFIDTNQWPDEPYCEDALNISWGLSTYERGLHDHRRIRQFPTKIQYYYHLCIIQHGIVYRIAHECSQNSEFAKLIMKEAENRATKKDEAEVAKLIADGREKEAIYHTHGYRDALARAKNRIRYHKKKKGWCEDVNDFRSVIEEFELYQILKIEACA